MNQLLINNNSDNWLENRAAFQNQTATFLEDNGDEAIADSSATQKPQNLLANSLAAKRLKRSQPLLDVTNERGKTYQSPKNDAIEHKILEANLDFLWLDAIDEPLIEDEELSDFDYIIF